MSRSFQIQFDFVSVCSSISGLAVGFSVSDLLVNSGVSTVHCVFQLNLAAKSNFLVSNCSLECVESQKCRCHFFSLLLV